MAFDALEDETTVPLEAIAAPTEPSPHEITIADSPEPAPLEITIADTPEPMPHESTPAPLESRAPELEPVLESAGDEATSGWTELPRTPVPLAEGSRVPKTEVNKSAFEIWLTRLKGRS